MTSNEFSKTYASKIRSYKANVRILDGSMGLIQTNIRLLNTKTAKAGGR